MQIITFNSLVYLHTAVNARNQIAADRVEVVDRSTRLLFRYEVKLAILYFDKKNTPLNENACRRL